MNTTEPKRLSQSRTVYNMVTRDSQSRELEKVRKRFLANARKSTICLLQYLGWSLHPAKPMYPQVEYAEDLGIPASEISRACKELVEYNFLFRCKLRSRVLYYLNPEHYWSGTEEERVRQLAWLRTIECPVAKPKRAKKKPAKARVFTLVSKEA